MNDVKNCANRLVKISDSIIKEFDILANLSYKNMEDNPEFIEHVNLVKYYLNQESVILNSLSYDMLDYVCDYLTENDDNSNGYSRATLAVLEKINLLNMNIEGAEEDIDYSDEVNGDIVSEFDILSEYIKEVNARAIDQDLVEDYFATLAIKKMKDRINNTYTDNHKDSLYKKRLLKYFNHFKYHFFSLDLKLERLGAFYKFDVSKVPIVPYPDIDIANICNNQCVGIINELYMVDNHEYDIEAISRALFKMISFEEYLDVLDDETVNRLLDLCGKLDKMFKDSFYGNITKTKLLSRRKN